jgi:tetratricopeptide (TPR) repeat protein
VVQNLETLGCFAISVGDTPAGFNWLQMALNAIDKSLNEAEFFRARIYCGISDCMMKIGKPQRAVEYADLAVLTASKARSPHLLAISKLSVARVHRFVGDTSEALQYATEVRVRARRDGWKLEELAAEKLLHETYYSVARFGEALEAILRALSLAEELGLHEDLAHLLLKAAQICRDLGRPMQAERYLQRAADLASISDQSEVMAQAQLALATAGLEIPSRNSLPSSQKDN